MDLDSTMFRHRLPRVSTDQRAVMMKYMQAHEDLARGKLNGPDNYKRKKELLGELTQKLNNMRPGSSKTPEKWYKCWQDWKSDVKAKALKIRQNRNASGSSSTVPLTPLEEKVVEFWGDELDTPESFEKEPKVSTAQQRVMMEFMQAHEDLARGKLQGSDAPRRKELLQELAESLNNIASGATKSPEKWLKCWQDWKSDVKLKSLRIRQHMQAPHGPSPPALTALEEMVVQFWPEDMPLFLPTPDPLQQSLSSTPLPNMSCLAEVQLSENVYVQNMKEEEHQSDHEEMSDGTQSPHSITIDDEIIDSLQRQASAIEHLSEGVHKIAEALMAIANAIQKK